METLGTRFSRKEVLFDTHQPVESIYYAVKIDG